MPSRKYLARIHILKKQAGLSDDQYRVLLNAHGVSSSADFTDQEAAKFANFLQMRVLKRNRAAWGRQKYEHLEDRAGDFASPAQLRKIEVMWRDIARNPSDEALSAFIFRQTGIRKIIWLKKSHVRPILIAMQKMKQ